MKEAPFATILTAEPLTNKKGQNWWHHIKSRAVLKIVPSFLRKYDFGSYLAPFHENDTTVSKRYYFSSSGVPFSTSFFFNMAGPSFAEMELSLGARYWFKTDINEVRWLYY